MRFKRNHVKKRREKAGLPPGSLIHVGEPKTATTQVRVLIYDDRDFQELENQDPSSLRRLCDPACKVWINVIGLRDVSVIESIGHQFGIDNLVLEDILNTEHHPKMEDLGPYLFVILKMMTQCDSDSVLCDQMSLVIFPNVLITFLERESPLLRPIHERLRAGKIRIRKLGSDYLAYSLIDAVVDHYFVVLDKIGARVEVLEDREFDTPTNESFQEILHLRRDLIDLRKSLWPLREVIAGLQNENDVIEEGTLRYIKDVYDHTIQIIETVESLRDTLAGILDLYLTVMSNRMNEAMKNLSMIATIFMPLTLIAGIYGMNFDFMPELHKPWGYPAVLLGMLGLFVAMLVYFRAKKWL